jgi:RNA polymerase sigma-70 factor (ECF subfamily)
MTPTYLNYGKDWVIIRESILTGLKHMYSNNHYEGINPIIISTVRKKARKLIKHKCFLSSDLEDLEQELMIDLLSKLIHYDSSKSSLQTFTQNIIENKASNLIRDISRKKRGSQMAICSLYEPIGVGDNKDEAYLLIDTISADSSFYEYSISDLTRQLEFEFDVRQVINKLPDNLGKLCKLLQIMTVAEIAEETGTSRNTVYKALKMLRTIFADSNIQDYLSS